MRIVKEMYNKEQKNQYIEYEGKNTQTLINYFKRISEEEKKYGKDIADMTYEELQDTLRVQNIRREETRIHLLSMLRGYVSWARLNLNATGGNAIDRLTPESFSSQDAVRSQMLGSPEQLKEMLESTLDFKDLENKSIRDSLLFWLLYAGLKTEQIAELKKNDIYKERNAIKTHDEEEYLVDEEVVKLWEHCKQAKSIEKRNSKSNGVSEYIELPLIDSDYLFRPLDSTPNAGSKKCKVVTLQNIVERVVEGYSKDRKKKFKLSPTCIRNSGIFYRLLQMEQSGVEITPEEMASFCGFNYKDNKSLMANNRKWRIDYEDWKKAFGYV